MRFAAYIGTIQMFTTNPDPFFAHSNRRRVSRSVYKGKLADGTIVVVKVQGSGAGKTPLWRLVREVGALTRLCYLR